MVLVSYPERAIQGINFRLGASWDVARGNKKAGRYLLARARLYRLCVLPMPASGIQAIRPSAKSPKPLLWQPHPCGC